MLHTSGAKEPLDHFVIVRFIRTKGFVSDGIRFVTHSYINHVEFGTPRKTWIGAHAITGIKDNLYDYTEVEWERRYRVPLTETQYNTLMKSNDEALGTPYNYKAVVGIFFNDHNLSAKGTDECAQFVFSQLWNVGVLLGNALPDFAHFVSPELVHFSSYWMGKCVPNTTEILAA